MELLTRDCSGVQRKSPSFRLIVDDREKGFRERMYIHLSQNAKTVGVKRLLTNSLHGLLNADA